MDRQQDDFTHYAIDIANKPEVMSLVIQISSLLDENDIVNITTCRFLNVTVFLVEFPPCDPTTFKLLPICDTECPNFNIITSCCFRDGIEEGIMISGFAALYDSYNCSDPSTHLHNVSEDLFDTRYCYNVSYYNSIIMGKCIY